MIDASHQFKVGEMIHENYGADNQSVGIYQVMAVDSDRMYFMVIFQDGDGACSPGHKFSCYFSDTHRHYLDKWTIIDG